MSHSLARKAIVLANFAWFGAGFVQFSFRARKAFLGGIVRKRGESTPTHVDQAANIFRYLGAMGGSLAVSNLPMLNELLKSGGHDPDEMLKYLFGLWGAAHASQALTTITVVAPSGRWRWEGLALGFITYIDVVMASANFAAWWFEA